MNEELITSKISKSRISEAFRTLRTNLQFSAVDRNIKIILITSAAPGEGKSTITSNLGITIAQSKKKVLIMDCDLRKPQIQRLFQLRNVSGLTSILVRGAPVDEYIIPSTIPNLYIMPSGPIPPNPAELLSTNKMKNVLEGCRSQFDIVLIDGPPVLAVADPLILASMTDGVLLVVSYGKVDKQAVIKTKDMLSTVGAKILGTVLNKVPEKSDLSLTEKRYYENYYSDR